MSENREIRTIFYALFLCVALILTGILIWDHDGAGVFAGIFCIASIVAALLECAFGGKIR
jgi:hypothetical protein